MSKINDGGLAFPGKRMQQIGTTYAEADYPGMTLRDWFASHAPEPHADYISMQQHFDRGRNPHNDSHKPKLRSSVEIVAAFKFEFADAMIAAREVKP